MSELRINNITDRAGSSGPIIAGVSTVTSTSHMVIPSGPTEMRGGRGRGVVAGGYNPYTDTINKFEIATTGDAIDFGNLNQVLRGPSSGVSSPTRGIFAGGLNPSVLNTISFVQIMTTGDAIDFGDMSKVARNLTSLSDCHGGLGGF